MLDVQLSCVVIFWWVKNKNLLLCVENTITIWN
jgi:hypothetical protein